ncbi:MAG: DUF3040 domain-containing protein [Cryobacterium sp.]|nr:DUF3040 domain-containing protein [Cryobacterium sp.]
MPLSEQEQRLLDEMERNLYQHDVDFVATISGQRGKPNYTWMALGALLGVVGVIAVLVGISLQQPLIGLAGFVMILGGVLLALARPKSSAATPQSSGSRPAASKQGFMDRMNERWDKREEERGR